MNHARHESAARPAFANPDDAVRALCARLAPVEFEPVALEHAVGRVLATALHADRDSPPCNVSAMDGYALRLVDLQRRVLDVAGEASMGQPPPPLPPGRTLRVFTGAPLPPEAEVVIPREDVEEAGERITLQTSAGEPKAGQYIRRRGENLRAGELVLGPGTLLTSAAVATLASFGLAPVAVARKLRLGIINTGSELVAAEDQPHPWQIRDTNGPGLAALLARRPWIEARSPVRVQDDYAQMRSAIAETLNQSDALLITGAVSAGQYDRIPDVIAELGAEKIFHKLPQRPGRPILGAVGPQGQAILGLPGNPVSAMVTTRRLTLIVLRHLAGMSEPHCGPAVVRLTNPDDAVLPLWWYRLVRLTAAGEARLVPMRGSGDVVALGRSDGFVELPPQATGPGPWPYYAWES